MPRRSIPRYCLHKGSGQAYVKIDGKRRYLGVHGTAESHREYTRVIGDWQARQSSAPTGLTVSQLCILFTQFADIYYSAPDGEPTGEADNFRDALKPLVAMFRNLAVQDFGPRRLEQVRERLIEKGYVRTSINKRVCRIRQVFRWGVSKELVPVDVYAALQSLPSLREGRSKAVEPHPVLPVPESDVDAIKAFVTAPVWAMIQLQLLTGMRPSEVRMMRCGDIDRSAAVWSYTPRRHKTAHRRRRRVIFIGPKSQLVLRPFLTDDADLFVFRPTDGRAAFVADNYRDGARASVRNSKGHNSPYSHHGYDASIRRACKAAGVALWSPGRLRHNAATNIRREFGDTDAARCVLGHASPTMTEVYAEKDFDAARAVIARIG